MTNIKTWLEHHNACSDGGEWATANCATMQDVWDTAKPEWLIWVATRRGTLTPQMQRKFACWCVRQIWHLLTDERSKNAVAVAEKHADGMATDAELGAAWDAAWDAAREAAEAAARAAELAAAEAAARAAALAAARAAELAARDAAVAAARAAAWAAAWDAELAARAAAWDAAEAAARAAALAAREAQAQWLRKNCNPNFDL